MSSKWYIIILLFLSVVTHFAFFGYPNQTVFDEVHFGKFISAYYTGEYYYDIHPPLAKLIIAGFAYPFDFRPEFAFTNIGDKFQNNKYLWLRLLPSLAGTLLPLVIYLLILKLGLSRLAALTGGLLIIFENALLTQSRLILLDPFLLLFGFVSLLFYFKYRETDSKCHLLLTVILASLAASIKWTGLAFLALAGIFELYHIIKDGKYLKILKLALYFVAIPLLIYFAIFALHFSLLDKPGSGDTYMDPGFHSYNVWQKFVDLNIEMYRGNARLTATHSYGSEWYSWPFMARPIFYWVSDQARIYYQGNPLIYWVSIIAVLMLLVGYLTSKKERNAVSTFLLSGFLLNLLPFIGIKRVMFIYHYAIALVFAILILIYLADQEERSKLIFTILIIAGAAAFVYFAPLTYGLPLSPEQYENRVWFNSWR